MGAIVDKICSELSERQSLKYSYKCEMKARFPFIFFAHPPGRKPRKIICGAFNFWHQFQFSIAPSKGGSFVGSPFAATYSLSWLNSNSRCAPPRGVIRRVTVWCITHSCLWPYSISHCAPQAGPFVGSPFGASNSLKAQISTYIIGFQCICCYDPMPQ